MKSFDGLHPPAIFQQFIVLWMIEYLTSAAALVYIALLFQALGFMARDELVLRMLILIGSGFYLLYYFFINDAPLKEAMFASGVLALVNLAMIVLLVFERTTFTMGEEMSKIYKSFPTLNPGQFRKVYKAGTIKEGQPGQTLVTDGKMLKRLLLITDGEVKISKAHKEYFSEASVFIGEVSFLREGPASANVEISKPAKYIEWHHNDLRKLMRKPEMNNALIALFGAELAGKVENAMPIDMDKQVST